MDWKAMAQALALFGVRCKAVTGLGQRVANFEF